MESKAKRTLVKSAPELWGLADDLARMEAWMAGLVGSTHPVDVEVTDREPERILAWRTCGVPFGRIALEFAEKGFGTAVSVTAQHATSTGAEAILEQVLDELAAPERRPFAHA